MKRIAAILSVLASPLAAQDFTIDPHLIDRCLPVHDNPMNCVGRQADACIQRNGGGADMIIGGCMAAEADVWDKWLNSAYRDTLDLAEQREGWDIGYEPGELTSALRNMQRTWITYRDAVCANQLAIVKPFGSAAGPAAAECRMTETARQYFVLRDLRWDYTQ